MPAEQLSLPLASPLDHYEALHPRPVGTTIYWFKGAEKGEKWCKVKPGDYPPIVTEGFETFLSPNEFAGWRCLALLRTLNCCYVDIDEPGIGPQEIAQRLKKRKLPQPTLLIYSGGGVHCYWLLEQTNGRALPVWQAIQNRLIDALGGDPKAKDAARVLRVVGSAKSTKAPAPGVVTGEVITDKRWTLHELADAVLGERWKSGKAQTPNVDRKAGVRDMQPRRGYRHGLGVYQRWHRVYEDLICIADHYGGEIPEGYRQTWLFLAAVALSWFIHPTGLEEEVRQLAAARVPGIDWTKEHPRTALRRAQASADGETVEWAGESVDPRYRFRRSTLYEWCEGMVPAELVDDLRAIIPDEVAQKRKQERDSARWSMRRGEYEAQARERRDQARRLRAEGLSWAEVGNAMGITAEAARSAGRR